MLVQARIEFDDGGEEDAYVYTRIPGTTGAASLATDE
jgi:hypothetical protein